jgi:hypothetical protein
MARTILVKADTNDADYITRSSKLNEEDLPTILKVVAEIKAFDARTRRGSGEYNWYARYEHYGRKRSGPREVYEDVLTEEEIEIFEEYIPYGEDGIHTIESVEIFEIINKEKLL